MKIPKCFCERKNCTYKNCKYHLVNQTNQDEKITILNLSRVEGCKLKGKNTKSYELTVISYLKSLKRYKTRRVCNLTNGKIYDCAIDASEKSGISAGQIRACCRGKIKTAGGFGWAYLDI